MLLMLLLLSSFVLSSSSSKAAGVACASSCGCSCSARGGGAEFGGVGWWVVFSAESLISEESAVPMEMDLRIGCCCRWTFGYGDEEDDPRRTTGNTIHAGRTRRTTGATTKAENAGARSGNKNSSQRITFPPRTLSANPVRFRMIPCRNGLAVLCNSSGSQQPGRITTDNPS